MHAVQLLHKQIKKSCVGIHAVRLTALFTVVRALLDNGKLTVTGLGRALSTNIKVKYNIKRVDRLASNLHLHSERERIYQATSTLMIGNTKHPLIIIDWSPTPDINLYLLRASIPTYGRSITVYEEIHSTKKQNNSVVHKEFIKTLSNIIPNGCTPICVLDAGFHSPFFQQIEKLGWDWVARSRNTVHYKDDSASIWKPVKSIYSKATNTPQFICTGLLSQRNPIHCNFYVYKGKKKKRVAKNKLGKRKMTSKSKKHAQANKEPWVLVTSIKGGKIRSKKIIAIYKRRMQIEEGFRDLKSSRFGFCFEQSKTYKSARMEVLLLIAMLAALAALIIGKAGEQKNLQYGFQANTERKVTQLSLFFLGSQIIKNNKIKFTQQELLISLLALKCVISQGWEA